MCDQYLCLTNKRWSIHYCVSDISYSTAEAKWSLLFVFGSFLIVLKIEPIRCLLFVSIACVFFTRSLFVTLNINTTHIYFSYISFSSTASFLFSGVKIFHRKFPKKEILMSFLFLFFFLSFVNLRPHIFRLFGNTNTVTRYKTFWCFCSRLQIPIAHCDVISRVGSAKPCI